MYADYDYYVTVFHGKLSKDDYTPLADAAEAYIDSKTDFALKKFASDTESELYGRVKMCSCVLADRMYKIDRGGKKTSEKVGDYSVSYANDNVKSADEQLWDILQTYIPDLAKAARWI